MSIIKQNQLEKWCWILDHGVVESLAGLFSLFLSWYCLANILILMWSIGLMLVMWVLDIYQISIFIFLKI